MCYNEYIKQNGVIIVEKIRLGVIGIGNQGSNYLKSVSEGKLPEIEIPCIADIDERKFERAKSFLPDVKCFSTAGELINSGMCDAVAVCTPHYFHPTYVIDALNAGLHVISEKPAGVYTKQVEEAIAVSKKSDKTYAMMFNQRTNPIYIKLREIVKSGKYGELRRVIWINTDWYRTQAYYDSGSWRATWEGEGGGVMLNQCPHQLDLWQWICGMPCKIRSVCREGKWHDIEVEDDITIYAEYPNGASGIYIATTGDYPGTNRFEITLEKAKVICEYDAEAGQFVIKICELNVGMSEYIRTAEGGFAKPKMSWITVDPVEGSQYNSHEIVLNAFAAHILRGEPLIAEGPEGINGLTISNAAFLSSWLDKEVTLPIDGDLFLEMLNEKIRNSTYKKNLHEQIEENMNATY